MADRSIETKPKVAPRVFLATVALGAGLAACKEIGVKSGDSGTIVKATNCWQYPGGKNATRIEAPLGQIDNGSIRQGAQVTIEAQENDPFGPTSHLGRYLRVKINGEDIEPSLPIQRACWIKSSDFSPAKK